MPYARRTTFKVKYRNYDISEKISSINYSDNLGITDDITITCDDREKNWLNECFPKYGDKLELEIGVRDWRKDGDTRSIYLGCFDVDSVTTGQTVKITGVSVPLEYGSRKEKKYKTYENVILSAICKDIADKCGLKLLYDVEYDPFYDKIEQSNKTDIDFLETICRDEGLCVKITNGQLVIFDEAKYDKQDAAFIIRKNFTSPEREDNDIIGIPTFKYNVSGLYEACEITYYDSANDITKTGYFKNPNASENLTSVLRLKENFNEKKDSFDLDRKARLKLREQNKNEWTISMKVVGDIIYSTGINVMIEGWGAFDGKYAITSCKHNISESGYICSLELRRCLDY